MQVHILRERQQDIRHLEDDADCQSIQKLHGGCIVQIKTAVASPDQGECRCISNLRVYIKQLDNQTYTP